MGMTVYRVCLLSAAGAADANGKLLAMQRLHADTDKEALGIARETVKGSVGLTGFELWEGERRVGAAETRKRERNGR